MSASHSCISSCAEATTQSIHASFWPLYPPRRRRIRGRVEHPCPPRSIAARTLACYSADRAYGRSRAAKEGAMRFGFFDQLPCASGYTERQRYQDILAQFELGDALGFDTAWLGELHFSRAFSILASPLMLLAA